MSIEFLLQTPRGTNRIGVIRSVNGIPAFVNDQFGGRTDVFIRKYHAPMSVPVTVVNWLLAHNIEDIYVRGNAGVMFHAPVEAVRTIGVLDNLGCEDQFYLPLEYWEPVKWSDLQMKFEPKPETLLLAA